MRPRPPMALERGEVLGGVFEIERCLESDYGVTSYRARHLMTGKPTRVRVLAPHKCAWAKPLLEHADELVALDVDGLARCVGHGRVGRSQCFLAFEWLRGETVDELLPAPLDRRLVLELAVNVAEALGRLHELDLSHGHVRPERILVEGKGDRGPVLLDAALPAADGVDIGTPSTMAPEAFIHGAAPGPAADVFALGATLHHALFGRPPHAGKTRVAVWLRTLFDTKRALDFLGDADPLATLIGRMLAPEPLERPLAERVHSIALDLLAGRAIAPIPPGSSTASSRLDAGGALLLVRGLPWQDPFFKAVLEERTADGRVQLVRFIDDTAALRFEGALDPRLGSLLHATVDTLRRAARVAFAAAEIGPASLDALVDAFTLTPAGQERLSPAISQLLTSVESRRSMGKGPGGTLELDDEVKRGKHGTLVMEPDMPGSTDDDRRTLEEPLPTMEIPVDPVLIASSAPSQRGLLKETAKTVKRKVSKTTRTK